MVGLRYLSAAAFSLAFSIASISAREPVLEDSVFAETTRFTAGQGTPLGEDAFRHWQQQKGAPRAEAASARSYGAELEKTQWLAGRVAADPFLGRAETAGLLLELVNQDHALEAAQVPLAAWFAATGADLEAKKADGILLERHAAAVAAHEAAHQGLLSLLRQLRAAGADEALRPQALEFLAAWFSANPATSDRPLSQNEVAPLPFGMQPPVSVVVDLAELDLSEDGMVIAPRSVPSAKSQPPPAPADTAQTLEVVFTPEITALAAQLGNSPLRIFNWVRNEIEFDAYVGSRRGAAETLRLRAGNDMDQASLLIALLRVSGIPARYTTGMVEMEAAAATSWAGVADPFAAGSLFATAGMEAVTITDGTTVAAIRCRRVWVEAHVPYTDYRGAGAATGDPIWVRLDPAFKTREVRTGVEITAASGFNPDTFLNTYFASTAPQTVLEAFEADLSQRLAAQDPPLTLEQNRLSAPLTRIDLPWLPASLPNRILSVDSSYTEIPSDRRFKVRFQITGQGATLDHTVDLPSMAGKQVSISYIGATAADVNAINAAGGLFGISQPWLIQVKPQLRVGGCVVATGTGGVTLGRLQDSRFHFTTPGPNSATDTIVNTVIAGNYQGNAIDTGRARVDLENKPTTCPEDFTGGFLHRLGMLYLELNDQADRRVAADMQAVLWKGVSNAILAQQVKVAYSGTTPVTFDYAGLSVDADRAGATPFSAVGGNILYTFGRIRGAQSSQNENLVFEQNVGRESVSTIKILRLAGVLGIPLFHIDSTNANTLIPQLNQSTATKNDLIAEINAGRKITIPRDSFRYIDWSGTGYIYIDPANGTGGYIISGGISGGATADDDEKKPGCEVVTNVVITPPAPGNVYSTCQKEPVEITVTLTGYDEECEASGTRTVKKTVDPQSIAPGSYDFKFGSSGDCGCSESTVTVVIKQGDVIYKDSDKRVAVNGILEIAAVGQETITASSPGKPDTRWQASGQNSPPQQQGESVDFTSSISSNSYFAPAAILPLPALVYFTGSIPSSPIEATNLSNSCGSNVSIYGFPSNGFEFAIALDKGTRSKAAANLGDLQDIFNVLDTVDDVLAGLDEFADVLNAPFEWPKPEATGSVVLADQIKEIADSNRVEYAMSLALNGEFGLKGEFPVGTTALLGIPPPLANASVFIPFGATIAAKISGELVYKRTGQFSRFTFPAELSGKVTVGVGARASLLSGFASLTVSGNSGFGVIIPINVVPTGSRVTASGEISVQFLGLTMNYQTSAIWGAWTTQDQWVVMAPKPWPNPPKKFEIFDWNFASN